MSVLRKAIPFILSGLAVIGTAATAVIAIKATPKAKENRRKAEIRKQEESGSSEESELTIMEVVQAEAPAYLPAATVWLATTLCILGAGALNLKQQASLASAYALAERTYHQYKDKVKAMIGPEADHAVEKAIVEEEKDILEERPPWNEEQTFFIECGEWSTFFDRTMEQVKDAEYLINRSFRLKDYVTFNELLKLLDLPEIEHGDEVGWNSYDGEAFYGYSWIDFEHRWFPTDDGLTVCSIDMPFAPHPNVDPITGI